jgi:SPP1 gp7 family putative phage head morphogenesis protein
MTKKPIDRNNLWAFHTNVQGVANAVAELLSEAIGQQDSELLAMLQAELSIVREWILGNQKSPKAIFDKLESVREQIAEIEHRGVQNTFTILPGQAGELAHLTSLQAAQEIQTALENEKTIRRSHMKSELTDIEIRNMLDYKPFADGKTIQQWFGDLEYNISSRIFQSVQKGIVEGMTLNTVMQVIRGSEASGFTDGIPGFKAGVLKTNRQSAEILARTIINAAANQSRLELYRANADVLDGVQWIAAFDHRTCMICAAYNGKVWTQDQWHEVKVPPAHPNCRCILNAYIDTGDGGTRPAEAENFDLLAKEQYEKKYKGKKEYNDLSYEYRRKLRYAVIAEYQDKTGNAPYKRMKSDATFVDYLKSQPKSFLREWLGKRRFELYQSGKLMLDQIIHPDKGFKRTTSELKELCGRIISPV